MPNHSHGFVETYDGLVGFGYDRETDENTIICYLQEFSDGRLMEKLVKRLSDEELETLFTSISGILKRHLNESEYHELFLKS